LEGRSKGGVNVIKLRVNSVKNGNLLSIEKPPHPLGTPPKEGKSHNFLSFGGVPERRGGSFPILNLMTLRTRWL
jgi:hypothetical protein